MTDARVPPPKDVLEFALIGPGYGETIVFHLGNDNWVIVDSCKDEKGQPRALRYLEDIGVDPQVSVVLVVATHWHDDHIRGMSRVVEVCQKATFSCAAVLTKTEFMATVRALEHRHLSAVRSGFSELHAVLETLRGRQARPAWAVANRIVFSDDNCSVLCLSPDDAVFDDFLGTIHARYERVGQSRTRIPVLRPNRLSVALWAEVYDTAVLLGGDLTKAGWVEIVDLASRPNGIASLFKVPHHGAPDAHETRVWQEMLHPASHAVLTPWNLGGKFRPSPNDARRLLSCTRNAYATAGPPAPRRPKTRHKDAIQRTLAGTRTHLRSLTSQVGTVRLRKEIGTDTDWKVDLFGGACHLRDYANGPDT